MRDESGGNGRNGSDWPGFTPGTVVAGFTIEGLISTGSSGAVYRARRGEQLFAIKLVPRNPRGDREVDALRRMRHPNVVGFHGYGFWPDDEPRALVLALELVDGRPLDVWAREENPSALELVSQVLLPLALTLADVHAAGVVHRDIKEPNIVMREADGLPVLVDFGAAGLEDTPRLTLRLPPGTPEYRGPEAWRFAREWEGEPYPAGPGDDLWALGVVTYAVLTRRLPFGDRRDPGMVRAILHEPPPAPHALNPSVPLALSELCLRMLEKEPGARFASARELAEALATEWARADRSWLVPLFPGAGHEERPAPSLARPERQPPRRQWLAASSVLTMALALLATTPTQPPESPSPPPPQQASTRQELASTQVTGEVVPDAGPQKSPTPAPVAPATSNEETQMMTSKKARSLAAATLITCVGPGCASVQRRQPPPEEACPPGSEETLKRFGILVGQSMYLSLQLPIQGMVPVSEGGISVWLEEILPERLLPYRSMLHGKLLFGDNRVYGRFTKLQLKGSEEFLPICIELDEIVTDRRLNMNIGTATGVSVHPGSTPEKAIVRGLLRASVVHRFGF
ncbi:serine/threonine protein kinase [Archangium violaceum]|uniref:serine/threonine protein kinase n=1 Tax=Archangium violaceum TaxID=83451 RepID=UPI00193BA1F7|nr:serine/threonine-protein kinase [Archangium violaceum]QRK06714.1 serine/threonine protein kinase [Archangium violaceum]